MMFERAPKLDPKDQRPQIKRGALMPNLPKILEFVNERLARIPLDLTPQGDLEKDNPPRPLKGSRRLRLRYAPRSNFQILVNKMTNHQRNQWARAGYPGLRHEDPKPLRRFMGAMEFQT